MRAVRFAKDWTRPVGRVRPGKPAGQIVTYRAGLACDLDDDVAAEAEAAGVLAPAPAPRDKSDG